MSRVLRWGRSLIFLAGMSMVSGVVLAYLTAGAMVGTWHPQEPELSDQTLGIISDTVRSRMGGQGPAVAQDRRPLLNPEARLGLARLGVRLAGKIAANVTLRLTRNGYAFEGDVLRLTLISTLYQGGPGDDVKGCLTGTYTAIFPLLRVTCGDGSGRELHFLMKNWPGNELRILPIPFGNDAVSERIRSMRRDKALNVEQLKALDELLTLRLERKPS